MATPPRPPLPMKFQLKPGKAAPGGPVLPGSPGAKALLARLEEANQWLKQGKLEEARQVFEGILKKDPLQFDSLHLLGVIEFRQGRLAKSEQLLREATSIRTRFPKAHANLSRTLQAQGKLDEALQSIDKAIALTPNDGSFVYHRSLLLHQLGRLEEAVDACTLALNITPLWPEALTQLGVMLCEMGRYPEAKFVLDRALSLRPDYADALHNLGNVFNAANRRQEAAECYEKVVAINPSAALAWEHLSFVRSAMDQYEPALEAARQALALRPDLKYLLGSYLHIKSKLCDWHDFETARRALLQSLLQSQQTVTPFAALALLDEPALHRQAARQMAGGLPMRDKGPLPVPAASADGRLRIGYFSADLHEHATAYLMIEALEHHDRSRFELFAFSYGPQIDDAMQVRLKKAFDHFIDIRPLGNKEVAHKARELGLDIAIDLKGYTGGGRPEIMAARCAPVQVSYLGYPGTLGDPSLDYVLADSVVIPPGAEQDYDEAVARLPFSYQANDSGRPIAQRQFSREELGLPAEGFVFCCFNNAFKILPEVFDSWMRILAAVPGSVLWLFQTSATGAENLRREALARGVAAERLVFAPNLPLAEHLARHAHADLFLDTWPYNAHTTASDALWAGLPLLTRAGRSFASRVAASLLTALGLTELITDNPQDYEALAIALAQDGARLSALKQKLMAARQTSPLFNGKLMARHLEAAYLTMHQRRLDGLRPASFDVPA